MRQYKSLQSVNAKNEETIVKLLDVVESQHQSFNQMQAIVDDYKNMYAEIVKRVNNKLIIDISKHFETDQDISKFN